MPILFSAPMVRAILCERKTQTRRIVKPQPVLRGVDDCVIEYRGQRHSGPRAYLLNEILPRYGCPYGVAGDRLWVRETHKEHNGKVWYRADPMVEDCVACSTPGWKWTPAIHMRREYSRITLEITEIRVQRLQEISAKDILAEGAVERAHDDQFGHNPVSAFDGKVYMDLKSLWAHGWESINGKGSWASNPWVWAITFKPAPPKEG